MYLFYTKHAKSYDYFHIKFRIILCFQANSVVEFKHPESGQLIEGVVSKLTDCSMYTVGKSRVFCVQTSYYFLLSFQTFCKFY